MDKKSKKKNKKRLDSKEISSNFELKSRLERLINEDTELDSQINELLGKGITADLKPQMEILHEYNEIKDLTQMVLGYLADAEQCFGEMSDTSEDTIQCDRQSDKDDNICRDFLRGICDRKFCKYKHENEINPLNFCHDFQNNICPRPHCKFIHCTPEEVEEYKRTGQMSNQILAEGTRKNQLPGNIPICNQFKKGMCRRNVCKYRHLTKEQEEAEIMELVQNNNQRKNNPAVLSSNTIISESPLISLGSLNNVLRRNGVSFDDYTDEGLPLIKKRFMTTQEQEILSCNVIEPNRTRPIFRGYFAGNPPSPMLIRSDARTLMLEEENSLLHKEIVQLKRQVSDLTATNEFLLDQNAALRVNGKRNGTVPAAVAITAANSGAQTRQVIASVATVPVSLATVSTCNPVVSMGGAVPAVSIASPQAQLLAASNQQILVTTNPTPQLAIANSGPAQLAIAQQNLANNLAQQAQPQLTSQAQQLALATTTQQLTSQAQHMANQQIALANAPQHQAQQLAASQQLTLANTNQQLTSQAQQLALAGTNQQLTSQAQQLTITNTPQQFSVANTPQQLNVANVPQQITLTGTNQQLIAAPNQQIEIHRSNQITGISTSQAIAMSNASQPMVSYPIMTQQSINHSLTH